MKKEDKKESEKPTIKEINKSKKVSELEVVIEEIKPKRKVIQTLPLKVSSMNFGQLSSEKEIKASSLDQIAVAERIPTTREPRIQQSTQNEEQFRYEASKYDSDSKDEYQTNSLSTYETSNKKDGLGRNEVKYETPGFGEKKDKNKRAEDQIDRRYMHG